SPRDDLRPKGRGFSRCSFLIKFTDYSCILLHKAPFKLRQDFEIKRIIDNLTTYLSDKKKVTF
ncbi:hypothetical protein M3084_09850, partial [Succinatimonas hippei]|uniref:hypothetical protein n=1 Tax=Succinatimonas hippei TaxID=626938 RepID=UPI0020110F05